MATEYDGHKLANELEHPHAADGVDLLKVAATLRDLANKLYSALKVANDLSESMDSVHMDRVALAAMVSKLTVERDTYREQMMEACPS